MKLTRDECNFEKRISIDGRIEARVITDEIVRFDNLEFVAMNGLLCIIGAEEYRCFLKEVDDRYLNDIISGQSRMDKMQRKQIPFSPAPRKREVMGKAIVDVQPPPSRKPPEKMSIALAAGPALTMAIPIILGCSKSTAVVATFISAAWAAINVINRKRRTKRDEKRRRSSYEAYIAECENDIVQEYKRCRNILETQYPYITEYIRGGANPYLMWNRLKTDDDYYRFRIGTGDVEFGIDIRIPKDKFAENDDSLSGLPKQLKESYRTLKDVPVCIDLSRNQVLGIVCDSEWDTRQIIVSLILQMAVNIRSAEIKIGVLFNECEDFYDVFGFCRFLNHCYYEGEYLVSCNQNKLPSVIEMLTRYSESNLKGEEKNHAQCIKSVVFTDDCTIEECLRNRYDVCVIYCTYDYSKLPVGTEAVLQKNAKFTGYYGVNEDGRYRTPVNFDRVSVNDPIKIARVISSIDNCSPSGQTSIPDVVPILRLFGEHRITEDDIIAFWNHADPTDSLAVPIGVGENDEVVYLDMHEKMHGPHGLVAGTTGSGKSELLQTIILSTAVIFPPDIAGFFLIDYKGGGMANLFSNLPHLLGSISNLSGGYIDRALKSVRSEVYRRQRLFLEFNVNKISDYQRLYLGGEATEVLPHVFIIIDEFAELKKEEPDFMQELISIAQIGRSLGLHLILATQKPAGCVDEKIRSNSRFKLCLRMQDKQDSVDMLERNDAAFLKGVGRCYMKVGNDEILKLFQSAYSMAWLESGNVGENIRLYDRAFERQEIANRTSNGNFKTQMEYILDAVSTAYDSGGFKRADSLWQEPLGDFIGIDEIANDVRICIGEYDDPLNQDRGRVYFEPERNVHTLITGMSGFGKSTLLQTLLYGMVRAYTPGELQLYIADFGGGLLKCFALSKLVGGYVTEDDEDNVGRMFGFIEAEMKLRRRILAGTGFDKAESNLPKVYLVIDNYADLIRYVGEGLVRSMMNILKNGITCGIYMVVTANDVSTQELPSRMAEMFMSVYTLTMSDIYKMVSIQRGRVSDAPIIRQVPGRGIFNRDGRLLEFQAGVIYSQPDNVKRVESVIEYIRERNNECEETALQYPFVPKNPEVDDLFKRTIVINKDDVLYNGLPIGYVEQSGYTYRLPLRGVDRIAIVGKCNTGKKSCLSVISLSASKFGIRTVNISTAEGLLENLRRRDEPIVLLLIRELRKLVNDFYEAGGCLETERELCTMISNPVHAIIIAAVDSTDRSFLAGRKLYEAIVKDAYGFVLGGNLDTQNVFDFPDIPYSRQSQSKPPGRGTVAMYNPKLFHGNIIIPAMIAEEE